MTQSNEHPTVSLESISSITRLAGAEYSSVWEVDPNGEIIALRGYNIGPNKLLLDDVQRISDQLSRKLNRSRLGSGDIVFPCVGSIGNAVKIQEDDRFHINQNIAKITPSEDIDSDYLVQFLISNLCKREINRFNATTSQPNVLVGSLRQFQIPLPPLPEQKKIAEILSCWDKAIETTETLIEAKVKLKKGLMCRIFSGEIRFSEGAEKAPRVNTRWGKVPKNWRILHLGDLTELITKGTTPTTIGYNFSREGINFIKVESIDRYGNFILTKFAFIDSETNGTLKRSQLKEGDILFSIAGALGRVAVVSSEILPANTNQALSIIRLASNAKLFSSKYLIQFLRGLVIQKYISRITVQSAQPNLSLGDLKKFPVLLPPIEEQEKIGRFLEALEVEQRALENLLLQLKLQKDGLMQQLLTGRKRVRV